MPVTAMPDQTTDASTPARTPTRPASEVPPSSAASAATPAPDDPPAVGVAAETMRAITHDRYGGPEVLVLRTVHRPALDPERVLVRVRAASINAADWHFMRGRPYLVRVTEGLRRPKRLVAGVDLAGDVVAVGAHVTGFQPGDRVVGETGGAFAEYAVPRAAGLVRIPTGISYEAAAAAPMAALTALQAIRDKAGIQPGQRVLVHGAGGGVGTYAVQLALAAGAEVTGACRTNNVELVRSLGAVRVIDASREDVARLGERWDVILDVAGSRSLADLRRALAADGALVLVGAPHGDWVGPLVRVGNAVIRSRFSSQRLLAFLSTFRMEDLQVIVDRLEAGTLRSVVDRTYPLEAAADAMRYVETGRAGGKVVLTI